MGFSFKKKKSSRGSPGEAPTMSRSLSKRISRSFRINKSSPKPTAAMSAPAATAVAPVTPAPKVEETREPSPAPDDSVEEGRVTPVEEEVAPEKEGEEPAKEDEVASAKEEGAVQEEEETKTEEKVEEEAAPGQKEEEQAEAPVEEEKEKEEEAANAEGEEEEAVSAVNESITDDTSLRETSKESFGDVVNEPSIETVEQDDGVLLGWFQPTSSNLEGAEQERGLLDACGGMQNVQSMIDGAMAQTMQLGAQGMDLLNCGNVNNVAAEPKDTTETSPETRDIGATPKDDTPSVDEAAADGEAKPADDEAKPADDEAKPADNEAMPADVEAKPADDEAKPAEDEAKPAEDEANPVDDVAAREDSYFLSPVVLKKFHDFMDQAKSTIESSYSVAEVDKYLGKSDAKAGTTEASDLSLAVDVLTNEDSRNDSEETDPSFSTFSTEEIRQEG